MGMRAAVKVLGETLNGITTMAPPKDQELRPYFYLAGFASFICCAIFKMLYFDVEERHPSWHAMRNFPVDKPPAQLQDSQTKFRPLNDPTAVTTVVTTADVPPEAMSALREEGKSCGPGCSVQKGCRMCRRAAAVGWLFMQLFIVGAVAMFGSGCSMLVEVRPMPYLLTWCLARPRFSRLFPPFSAFSRHFRFFCAE